MITHVSLLLLLAANTGRSPVLRPEAAPARTLSACMLVTRGEIEAAIGRAVSPGEAENGEDASCNFAGGGGLVTVQLVRAPARPDMAAEMRALEATIEGAKARPVDGIGRSAFFLEIAGAGLQLHVVCGERQWLMVSVLGMGRGSAEMARRIALAALRRIG